MERFYTSFKALASVAGTSVLSSVLAVVVGAVAGSVVVVVPALMEQVVGTIRTQAAPVTIAEQGFPLGRAGPERDRDLVAVGVAAAHRLAPVAPLTLEAGPLLPLFHGESVVDQFVTRGVLLRLTRLLQRTQLLREFDTRQTSKTGNCPRSASIYDTSSIPCKL